MITGFRADCLSAIGRATCGDCSVDVFSWGKVLTAACAAAAGATASPPARAIIKKRLVCLCMITGSI